MGECFSAICQSLKKKHKTVQGTVEPRALAPEGHTQVFSEGLTFTNIYTLCATRNVDS